jgi:hypothetical protein
MEKEDILKKLLAVLEDDLGFYSPMIKEVSLEMVKEVKLGEPILLKEDYAREFSINACTLEELKERKLVLPDREADFIANYKNAKEFMCILFITPGDARFIYAPYKKKKNS